ncbi:MAG: bis(5'-nucleosyl)-tetraphosphatase (symmetrical) YqeK [Atopobiaceae bacterium]|jgi:predicted HD superfamily hydrolase involved in NAD metabolism|nr:bis(5'-nucleosyl)-tetraphosphatase (symmetrical) YqeK [Atopobiaceae bacterium]MCH4180062.1 bis(5'-nucleosyl)-tetraphosphatase (symmetrical) YqeK [Atopobiaceae bacterium]MCH4213886.1 bis(5'-nucleosyl)-tetraphosphatase (symmetrical) YqeK [Atopobiaceae bacterium]MCH4230124.1 bis(5'-nucleosyl)-tetraphosphatase (symmetrical) YqeK [Atopobiaceae bacterium]MCH4275651.1 bis(5'-nucleosyl)-tetraphosphatase (symmetrical) YqeK [Atopobiaceae bacterium]
MSKVAKRKGQVKRIAPTKGTKAAGWKELLGHRARFTPLQCARIERLEDDLAERLESLPKRLAHSLSVGRSAEALALLYGVDPYKARVAGILHDWDKVVPHDELIARAHELGIDLGVEPTLVVSLLHGMVAERELPDVYPDLPPDILQAIGRHTIGAADMTPLDDVIFVADGIEPLRPSSPGIDEVRHLVGSVTLPNLFWVSFTGGITYVVGRGRYLYPGTIDIYNGIVARGNHGYE